MFAFARRWRLAVDHIANVRTGDVTSLTASSLLPRSSANATSLSWICQGWMCHCNVNMPILKRPCFSAASTPMPILYTESPAWVRLCLVPFSLMLFCIPLLIISLCIVHSRCSAYHHPMMPIANGKRYLAFRNGQWIQVKVSQWHAHSMRFCRATTRRGIYSVEWRCFFFFFIRPSLNAVTSEAILLNINAAWAWIASMRRSTTTTTNEQGRVIYISR